MDKSIKEDLTNILYNISDNLVKIEIDGGIDGWKRKESAINESFTKCKEAIKNTINELTPQTIDKNIHNMITQRIDQLIEDCRIRISRTVSVNNKESYNDNSNIAVVTSKNCIENIMDELDVNDENAYNLITNSLKNMLFRINSQKENSRIRNNLDHSIENEVLSKTEHELSCFFQRLKDNGYNTNDIDLKALLYSNLILPLQTKIKEIDLDLYHKSKIKQQDTIVQSLSNKTIFNFKKNLKLVDVNKVNQSGTIKTLDEELKGYTIYVEPKDKDVNHQVGDEFLTLDDLFKD